MSFLPNKTFNLVERGEVLKAILSKKTINQNLEEADLAKIGQALSGQQYFLKKVMICDRDHIATP